MLKEIDLQMVAFVGASLLHDYLRFTFLPRIYYFPTEDDEQDDGRAA